MLPPAAGEAVRLLGESGGPQRVMWLAGDGRAWLTESGHQQITDLWGLLECGRARGFVSWDDGGWLTLDSRPLPVVCLAGGRLPLELAASAVWWSEPCQFEPTATPLPPPTYPELDPHLDSWVAVESGLWLGALAETDPAEMVRALHRIGIVRRERRERLFDQDVRWEQDSERIAARAGARTRAWLLRYSSGKELESNDASDLLDRMLGRLHSIGREGRGMEGSRLRAIGLAAGVVFECLGIDLQRYPTVDEALESVVCFDGGPVDDASLRDAASLGGRESLVVTAREFVAGERKRRQQLLNSAGSGQGTPLAIDLGQAQLRGGVWNRPQLVTIDGTLVFSPPVVLCFDALFVSAGIPLAWDRPRGVLYTTVDAPAARLEGDGLDIPDTAAAFDTLSIDSRQLVVRGGAGHVRTVGRKIEAFLECSVRERGCRVQYGGDTAGGLVGDPVRGKETRRE